MCIYVHMYMYVIKSISMHMYGCAFKFSKVKCGTSVALLSLHLLI